jgi:predicted dithiol-disulfide oxidoreductase (DUF899 family)
VRNLIFTALPLLNKFIKINIMANQDSSTSTKMKHKTVTREEWLDRRIELLKAEKELTHRSDEVAQKRQELPWVRIDKEYMFETEEGKVSLIDLFKGRSQLLIYHFMLGPEFAAGCPHCSAIADGFNGFWIHLANHDVMLMAVSRAPFQKIQAYKKRMEWTFPWASSYGSDFNSDFNISFTREQQLSGNVVYNYNRENASPQQTQKESSDNAPDEGKKIAATAGTDWNTFIQERPGMSAFVLEDGIVYHTYSTYARGLDGLWGIYQWLDRAPLGRNESGFWMRHHDKYDNASELKISSKDCCS